MRGRRKVKEIFRLQKGHDGNNWNWMQCYGKHRLFLSPPPPLFPFLLPFFILFPLPLTLCHLSWSSSFLSFAPIFQFMHPSSFLLHLRAKVEVKIIFNYTLLKSPSSLSSSSSLSLSPHTFFFFFLNQLCSHTTITFPLLFYLSNSPCLNLI